MAESTANTEFTDRTEPYRYELLAYCYRMLGSLPDAEDVLQEVYLRAWRSYDRFEGRSSVRTWLYRIATNACLTARQHDRQRVLPSGLDAASESPYAAPTPDDTVDWLGPLPDALITPPTEDPAAIAVDRDTVRLTVIAMLQRLSGQQRAVLVLRDVLDFPAAEVADLLDTTTAAVKSTLQRARAHATDIAAATEQPAEPTDVQARILLQEYITAFETSDPKALQRILHRDATIELPPSRTWFSGKIICLSYLRSQALGAPGDWRMLPTAANGRPAVAAYLCGPDGEHRAWGIALPTTTTDAITKLTVFGDPDLVRRCGLPMILSS